MGSKFPRTTVGGVSMPRLIVGTNWFRGFSHTSAAKDNWIKQYQTRKRVAEVLTVFLEAGVDAYMASPTPAFELAVKDAEQRSGRGMIRILTPSFNVLPGGPAESEPQRMFDFCVENNATFCLPHQGVTDRLVDRLTGEVRDWERYAPMIRERGMIPGFSTHMPDTIPIADKTGADVETYIQIYNSAGFLMQVEADWVMRIINRARKPVMCIKPLAAGRVLPPVGLAFVWNTIRDCDMVVCGTTTADEAREVIDLSLTYLERRLPTNVLQRTRSKQGLETP